jgi:hypothetical protein
MNCIERVYSNFHVHIIAEMLCHRIVCSTWLRRETSEVTGRNIQENALDRGRGNKVQDDGRRLRNQGDW